jgi:hypothetical protein
MMTKQHIYESHVQIVKRLKCAEGYRRGGDSRSCLELAQQLPDVAANGGSSKPTKNVLTEFKAIPRYL